MTETRNATKNFSQLMISKKSKEAFAEAARVSEALRRIGPFETTVSPLAAETPMMSKESKKAFAEAARVSEALKKAKPFETTVSPLAAEFC